MSKRLDIDDYVTVYDYGIHGLRRTQVRAKIISEVFCVYPEHDSGRYLIADEGITWIRGWEPAPEQEEAFRAAAALLK